MGRPLAYPGPVMPAGRAGMSALLRLAAGLLAALALALAGIACVPPERLVLRPAQQLAVALADLPAGFRVGEEMAPAGGTAPGPDPWGRLSAYSVTYVAMPDADPAPFLGNVVSSVNAYDSAAHARAAFAAWQAALPTDYRPLNLPRDTINGDVAIYIQETATGAAGPGRRLLCLAGLRVRNVMASIWVAAAPGATTPPVDTAVRLVRLTARRIDAVAGR